MALPLDSDDFPESIHICSFVNVIYHIGRKFQEVS